MNRTPLPLLAVAGVLAIAPVSGCFGGCVDVTSDVTTSPATPCLTLSVGKQVCGAPDLSIDNGCPDPLVLPPAYGSDAGAVTVAPGGKLEVYRGSWGGSQDRNTLTVTLGQQTITLSFTTRG